MKTARSFCKPFREAAAGKRQPFILVVEGSIPNENNKAKATGRRFGTDRTDGPADPDLRLDRPAGAERLGGDRGGNLRDLRRNSRHGRKSHGVHGLPDYLGWEWKSQAGIPIVCVPGCPVQPDNFMETLLYLLQPGRGPGAHDSAG